jgi:hypothetical protein
MIASLTWIRRIAAAGILMFVVGFSITSARAGQIVSAPLPTSSGPGMGLVNVALIVTPTPNNDDVPGALPDNDIIVPQKRFDFVGFIDTEFTVTTTSGVTEYLVTEGVDNNTGINWSAYTMRLGFGTGATFTQVGGVGDGLDFDTGPPGGNNTPPSSGAFPIVSRPDEDQLVFSGGVQGLSAQIYQFRIDVPDLTGRNLKFTLRQQPVPIPEPSAIALVGLAVVGLAMKRGFRSSV